MFILTMQMAGREKDCRWVWSVGAKRASGSKELSAGVVCRVKFGEWVKEIGDGCGLSGQVWRVGQRNCRRVWSVGTSMASGSKELSAEFGLSGRKGRVGQKNCRRVWSVGSSMASESRGLSVGVVCRGENVAWVKGTVARVWSVGAKMLRGSKGLSLECGLSA